MYDNIVTQKTRIRQLSTKLSKTVKVQMALIQWDKLTKLELLLFTKVIIVIRPTSHYFTFRVQ